MHWRDAALLDELGLNSYEKKALISLALLGVAEAGALCREGGIPTSKIYRAMEKLEELGLVAIQPTRPKLYASLPADVVVDRLLEISQERANHFARESKDFRALLASVPGRVRGRQTHVELALGSEGHVKRQLIHLATARQGILSYMEQADLEVIDEAMVEGFPVLRRISRNAEEQGVVHRVVFGFSYRTAPRLLEFLKTHRNDLTHLTGVRYSGELGHPFHVIDGEMVILPQDHPFAPERRFASLLVRDRELAASLTEGFETLWKKAMRDLAEINFQPR